MYIKDLKVRDRNLRLIEICRRGENDVWEYYFSRREDVRPVITPIGSPVIVVADSNHIEVIAENPEFYIHQAGIGSELFAKDPARLGFVRGFNYDFETSVSTSSRGQKVHKSTTVMVPYQFFIVGNEI